MDGGGSTAVVDEVGPVVIPRGEPRADRSLAGLVGRVAPGALVVLAVAAVAVTFAPWLRTGAARRTSHQVVQAADRLEVLEPGAQAAVSVGWAFLPLVAALAVLAVLLDRPRLGAALAALVGLAVISLAVIINNAPRSADWGAPAGLAIGSALVAAALATACTSRSAP